MGCKFGPKKAKSGPKLGQNCHCLKFGSLVFLELYTVIACNNVEHLVEEKPRKKFGGTNLGKNRQKSGPKIVFLPFSQVWFISFPLNCTG